MLGYCRLYGSLPGDQAEYLRVSHADYGPVKVPSVGEDERCGTTHRRRQQACGRGGTISLSGVYGGMKDPMPMMSLFDKQVQMRVATG